MQIGEGSTVIGNTATQNGYGSEQGVGIFVECPSNVTDNTAVNNVGVNLVLNGTGCNNTNNVAPWGSDGLTLGGSRTVEPVPVH